MSGRSWIPLEEAIQDKAAAAWVEWIETERENGVRCLKCLRRFTKPSLIPVNCRDCWEINFTNGQTDNPISIHPVIAPEDEIRTECIL